MGLKDFGLKAGRDGIAQIGPGRPKYLNETEIVKHLKEKYNKSYSEIENILPELYAESTEDLTDKVEELVGAAEASSLFKHFIAVRNVHSTKPIVFYQDGSNKYPVGTLDEFDSEVGFNTLNIYASKELDDTTLRLKRFMDSKTPHLVNSRGVVDTCFKILNLETTLPRVTIESEPHPIVIEGCLKPSLATIPFIEKHATLQDLNPYLQDFLSRLSDPRDLCANIWTNFIGIKTPYVIYIQGAGEDGKSGFVKMLGKLVQGSVCNYDWSERFNYFNMYGKSLILMNECKVPHVLQHAVLKQITGGDLVQIEGKGRNAFTAEVRGQLIIVSNNDPKVYGTPDEYRRLRFYRVKKSNLTEDTTLGPDEYINQLSSTPMEFLNYCRLAYEELKTPSGLVRTPLNQKEIMSGLRDPSLQSVFKKIAKEIDNAGFIRSSSSSCEVEELHSIIKKHIDKRDRFAMDNIEAVILAEWGVKREFGKFLGIGVAGLTKGEIL